MARGCRLTEVNYYEGECGVWRDGKSSQQYSNLNKFNYAFTLLKTITERNINK